MSQEDRAAPVSRKGRSPMGRPRIHVLLDDTTLTPTVFRALEHLGAEVRVSPFDTKPIPSASRLVARPQRDVIDRSGPSRRPPVHRIDDQLRLAASLQRNLQAPLPTVDGLDVHAFYRPADIISGDAYGVHRLDETHVAVTVADATGHGLPAGLLSTFVKRSLRGKELTSTGYRLLEPDEVLVRANADILETQLQECQFVTALYAVYDESTRTIRWARGGAPYPILVRRGDRPRQIISNGPLLGAMTRARFEIVEHQLDPGDTLIFHTDGLDAFLLSRHHDLGCCDLHRTDWFETLGEEPINAHLEQLEAGLTGSSGAGWNEDDITIVALHVGEPAVAQPRMAEPVARSATPLAAV